MAEEKRDTTSPGRTVLITGASSGIGKAFAMEFARNGFDVVLTARRKERLEELGRTIVDTHNVKVEIVADDLADPEAAFRIVRALSGRSVTIDALVNNAGYGFPDKFESTRWEQQRDFIQVLVTSGVALVHSLLPGMLERGYGRIINVASLAGLVSGASGYTLYGAAKSFMIKFSEALNLEVEGRGVHVSAVCPGFTYTEFHDVAGVREQVSRMPEYMWMDAGTVARQGFEAVMRNRPVLVNGRLNGLLALLARYMPQSITRSMARKRRNYQE